MSDAGWSQFSGNPSVKAACATRRVIVVNLACTSQSCSGCVVTAQKSLSVRWRGAHDGLLGRRSTDQARGLQRDPSAASALYRLPRTKRLFTVRM